MIDRPRSPGYLFARVARFIAEVCLVLIAGVGTGWLVWRLAELVR